MISLLVLMTVCFVLSSAANNYPVNWTVDDNTVPESLPDLMRNKYYRKEEIQNAVFWAYTIQYDVISEHNGRVYDAETPLGYFNDTLILPKTRASLINSNIVFENNTISGLLDFKSNNIVIRWSQDLISLVLWNSNQIGNFEGTLTKISGYKNQRYLTLNRQSIVSYDVDKTTNIEFEEWFNRKYNKGYLFDDVNEHDMP